MAHDGSDNLGKNINREQFGLGHPQSFGFTGIANVQHNGLAKFDRNKGITKRISLSNIKATQDYIDPEKAKNFADNRKIGGGKPPDIVRSHGDDFAWDGHHRLAGAMLRGQKTMKVNLFTTES